MEKLKKLTDNARGVMVLLLLTIGCLDYDHSDVKIELGVLLALCMVNAGVIQFFKNAQKEYLKRIQNRAGKKDSAAHTTIRREAA